MRALLCTCICVEVKIHPLLLASRALVRRGTGDAGAAGQALRYGVGHKHAGVPQQVVVLAVVLQVGHQRLCQSAQRLHMPEQQSVA